MTLVHPQWKMSGIFKAGVLSVNPEWNVRLRNTPANMKITQTWSFWYSFRKLGLIRLDCKKRVSVNCWFALMLKGHRVISERLDQVRVHTWIFLDMLWEKTFHHTCFKISLGLHGVHYQFQTKPVKNKQLLKLRIQRIAKLMKFSSEGNHKNFITYKSIWGRATWLCEAPWI